MNNYKYCFEVLVIVIHVFYDQELDNSFIAHDLRMETFSDKV